MEQKEGDHTVATVPTQRGASCVPTWRTIDSAPGGRVHILAWWPHLGRTHEAWPDTKRPGYWRAFDGAHAFSPLCAPSHWTHLPNGPEATHDAARTDARQAVRDDDQSVSGHEDVPPHDPSDVEMAMELGGMVRATAKRLTGGNCAFAMDDLLILEHLAARAIEAGLTDRLHWQVQKHIAERAHKGVAAQTDSD